MIDLCNHYIERGHKILDKKYHEEYDKIVPVRVEDLYHGMELKCFLDIIETYDKHHDVKLCAKQFNQQNHSGMSAGITASLIYHFHDEGDIIVRALGFECKDKSEVQS